MTVENRAAKKNRNKNQTQKSPKKPAKPAKTTKTPNKSRRGAKAETTELFFLIDRSGSMQSIAHGVMDGFKNLIAEQQKLKGKCAVSLYTFDNYTYPYTLIPAPEQSGYRYGGAMIETIYENKDVHDNPTMSLVARGMTPLYDAAMWTLKHIETIAKADKVIVMIMTDGLENASTLHNRKDVSDFIEQKRAKNNWQVTYVGANQDAVKVGTNIGIMGMSAKSYTANYQGTVGIFEQMSSGISKCRGMSKVDYDTNTQDGLFFEKD